MLLYHFTGGEFLRGIAAHGLTVGDVPTDISRLKAKIGVWFTSSEIAEGHGLDRSAVNKKRFRLKVDVPEDKNLVRWDSWASGNVTKQTREMLDNADGHQSSSWMIYFGKIDPSRIIEVADMSSGSIVIDWRTCWPDFASEPGVKYEDRFSWHGRVNYNIRRALAEYQKGAA
jgi:hypothetical protein